MTKHTTDREEIKRWAEERGGTPATVSDTAATDEVGVLVFDFPDYSTQESLEHISWEAFFDKFEENDLALIYQDETAGGETSRFFKFVGRSNAEDTS